MTERKVSMSQRVLAGSKRIAGKSTLRIPWI